MRPGPAVSELWGLLRLPRGVGQAAGGENLTDKLRKHACSALRHIERVRLLRGGSISRHAGCTRTVTIKDPASLSAQVGLGAPVAKRLGMQCTEYLRTAKDYPLEQAVWAAAGRSGILSWTLFDFPEPLCLFFTGWHGEKMWDRVSHDSPDPFVRRDPGSLDFCEYRLIRGVFQCPVPFWAARHNSQTRDITLSQEMAPWYTNRDYDKPIARRIIQDAGVPGDLFGTLKKNTSHDEPFRWPYSPDARARFADYLGKRGLRTLSPGMIRLTRAAHFADNLVYRNLLSRFGLGRPNWPWRRFQPGPLVFHWANAEMKQMYLDGLGAARQGDFRRAADGRKHLSHDHANPAPIIVAGLAHCW